MHITQAIAELADIICDNEEERVKVVDILKREGIGVSDLGEDEPNNIIRFDESGRYFYSWQPHMHEFRAKGFPQIPASQFILNNTTP